MTTDIVSITHHPADPRSYLEYVRDRLLWAFPHLHRYVFEVHARLDRGPDGLTLDPEDVHVQIAGFRFRVRGTTRPGGVFLVDDAGSSIHTQRELESWLAREEQP